MAGKYASIIDNLRPLPPPDLKYQARIEERKLVTLAELPDLTPQTLTQRYAELRHAQSALEQQLSALNLELAGVVELLVNAYEGNGIATLRLTTGESATVQPEPYAQVEDKDAFRLWCIAQGLERSLALPWQTTNTLTKDRLLAGQPEPDGVVAYMRPKVVFRKG